MELNRERPLYGTKPDVTVEREAHLRALQEQLAAQERDYQRKVRELGRAEQELEDERQIFLQDKKAFDRTVAQSKQRTRFKGLLLLPLLMVTSMGVGYASFAALSQDQVKMAEATTQLDALSQRLHNAELQEQSVNVAPSALLDVPVAQFKATNESAEMLQTLAQHPSSAGQILPQKGTVSSKVDELLEQLSLLKQEMIDQNVLMDVDDAFIEIQQEHMNSIANRLVQLQKETQSKAEGYDRLLQANRALVKQINGSRGEIK